MLLEDEQLQLALAISAAESGIAQAHTSAHPAWSDAVQRHDPEAAAPSGGRQPDTTRDEDLARALQQHLDADLAGPASPSAPPSNFWPPSLSSQHAGGARNQPAVPMQPPMPSAAAPAGGTLPAANGGGDPNSCGGCGKPVRIWHEHATAGGRKYHTQCLVCAHCKQLIRFQGANGVRFILGADNKSIYHQGCHKEACHPRCSVCNDFLPQDASGIIRFHHNPFWGPKFCAKHERDGTPRCTACTRLQPFGEQYVQTEAERHTCLDCLSTLVRNTADCQPLYDDVMSLYASLGMRLPTKPPLMLVESAALNEATVRDRDSDRQHGPVFHTRGLCLSQEYRSIRSVVGSRQEAGRLMSVIPQINRVASSRWEVTAILVLFGLPWLLTGSILAHECLHAWLRLSGYQRLSMDVEEGLAQLMALLWLERQLPKPGSYEERLASFLGNQIRTDQTAVYGDGFRAAHDSFSKHGLAVVLEHVRRHGSLPE